MEFNSIIEWLFTHAGPILRYRTAVELMTVSQQELDILRRESLATFEVQRWLNTLAQSKNIHGSRDTDAENAIAKLLDYGFDRSHPVIDQNLNRLLNSPLKPWDHIVFLPFLIRAGCIDLPLVNQWLNNRIDKLYQTAARGDFDFYLSDTETVRVPTPWRDKPIYRDEYGHQAGYALPTSYDLYALAYCPAEIFIDHLAEKREAIVAFLSDRRFQSTVGGYGWDKSKRRCYAAGRVFLACAEPARLVLFMELGASFASARRSEWFHQGLSVLENFRTDLGTYLFPQNMLQETSSNHIYGGSHMGLGENRRSLHALELESTFRMLSIYNRMDKIEAIIKN